MSHIQNKEWEKNQEKAFTSWVNYYLQKRDLFVNNICEDFKDGILLINLLEILFNDKAPKYYNPPKSRFYQIENANLALIMMKRHGIPNRGISAEDIVDGNKKLILGMVWTIAREAQMDPQGILGLNMKGTNGPKKINEVSSSVDESKRDDEIKRLLLNFVKNRTGIEVKDFTPEYWMDGKVLASLVSSFDDQIESLKPYYVEHMKAPQIIEEAVRMANSRLHIPPLFECETLVKGQVDPKSLMLYTSLFMRHQAEQEKKALEEAQKAEALRREMLEQEQQRTRQLEAERQRAEQMEAERQRAEQLEAERRRTEQLEAERRRTEQLEAERRRTEQMEAERQRAEQLEAERQRIEQLEAEQWRIQQMEAERRRTEQMKAERQRVEEVEAERRRIQQIEADQAEAQRIAEEEELNRAQQIEADRIAAEMYQMQLSEEQQRAQMDQLAQEQLDQEIASAMTTPIDYDDFVSQTDDSSNTPLRSIEQRFPNMPVGNGHFEGAAYVISSNTALHYNPISASSQYKSNSSTFKTYGRRRKGFMAIANRMVQETVHKLDKAYSFVSVNDTSFSQFRKYFKFRNFEPLIIEFPCKFASSDDHMMIGAMYITPNYLCFTGELLRDRLSVILSLADIEEIDEGVATLLERYKGVPYIIPASCSGSRPNALIIKDSIGKCHRLYSLMDPLKTYQMLYSTWQRNPLKIMRTQPNNRTLENTFQQNYLPPPEPFQALYPNLKTTNSSQTHQSSQASHTYQLSQTSQDSPQIVHPVSSLYCSRPPERFSTTTVTSTPTTIIPPPTQTIYYTGYQIPYPLNLDCTQYPSQYYQQQSMSQENTTQNTVYQYQDTSYNPFST